MTTRTRLGSRLHRRTETLYTLEVAQQLNGTPEQGSGLNVNPGFFQDQVAKNISTLNPRYTDVFAVGERRRILR